MDSEDIDQGDRGGLYVVGEKLVKEVGVVGGGWPSVVCFTSCVFVIHTNFLMPLSKEIEQHLLGL
jgi:hypothetical protein